MVKWPLEHISYVELGPDNFFVENHRTGFKRQVTKKQLAEYIRAHATSERHVPIGDYVHSALSAVGIKGCLPCAERQAKLNRLVKK